MKPAPIRVYSRLLEPREHPDYLRRAVRPPSWDLFHGRTQLTCLRTFEIRDERIVGLAAEIELYTKTHALGTVIWPSYPVLFASNLGELAAEIKRRGLYLFDIWGYVPGSGPGGYWRQFKVPPAQLALLESTLGERWLGTDIGEQDGRYINGYAGQMTPATLTRVEQYLNFQRHFERMGDDLGHKHATLVSLNFGHYFLKEGTYTLIGAETGQALPNNQVYYAFIRGAGKQYGVPWFGNASVWNRWSFKSYTPPGTADGFPFGPTKATSLSLLKRLLYTHLLYNGVLAGFETGWVEEGKLTPVGKIQQSAQQWINAHGQPGVMHTPVALLVDFHAGWSFPRHLYSERTYRVWGNLPYGPGDFLTDGILDLLYPGYQDSSYFHDETGFIAPTPFGDIADCILSDVQPWLLDRYPVVVLAGELAGGIELRDKLETYLKSGGHLVLTSGNLRGLSGGFDGLTRSDKNVTTKWEKGMVTLFASDFGIEPAAPGQIRNEADRSLDKPFVLEEDVRAGLSNIFRAQALFEVDGKGLSVVTCRKGPGEYTLGVANNLWAESPFRIVSRCGEIEAIRELELDPSEISAVGYLPEATSGEKLGGNGPSTIAGGDIRIFSIKVSEKGVVETPHRSPGPRPKGRWLTLRGIVSIKEAILARPTFFEHFDGVVVDWKYFHEREISALKAEAGWLARQGLRICGDLSSGANSYPTLRLIDNQTGDFSTSIAVIEGVLTKLQAVGSRDVILSLHRMPENNFTPAQAVEAFERTLKDLAQKAAAAGISLHLRPTWEKAVQRIGDLVEMVARVAEPNLKVAGSFSVSVAEQSANGSDHKTARSPLAPGLSLLAGLRRDVAGYPYDFHAPIAALPESDQRAAREWLENAGDNPVVFDAVFSDWDAEYLDARVASPLVNRSNAD